jgi:hypothetical protein
VHLGQVCLNSLISSGPGLVRRHCKTPALMDERVDIESS